MLSRILFLLTLAAALTVTANPAAANPVANPDAASSMTDVERLLWQALRGKQVNTHRFRRQHPIGPYIADLACIEQRTVVELDGGQHQERMAHDEQRTAFMQAQGWQVLRFWNNDVLENLDGVLSTIVEHLNHAPPS